jgi:hypothetical protein
MDQKTETILQRMLGFAVLRLQEVSTWRGITLVATAISSAYNPEYTEAIVTAGMFIAGLLGVLFPDAVKKAKQAAKEAEAE